MFMFKTFMRRSFDTTHVFLTSSCIWYALSIVVLSVYILSMIIYLFFIQPPSDFPHEYTVRISNGQTLSSVSTYLEKNNVIKSPFAFRMIAILLGKEKQVVAGDYYFHDPTNMYTVVSRITQGKTLSPVDRITIPEGVTMYDIAQILDHNLHSFDPIVFLQHARDYEGYLFPDTYSFTSSVDEEDVVVRMYETFQRNIKPLSQPITESSYTLEEIIIMASLIEKEANKYRDRRMISGVLRNRLEIKMPLQIDAAFSHVNGKSTYELTRADLQTDSPFNTYINKGLPPYPIANPGLDSIKAAVDPIDHNYLYYLADKKNNTYYAETFEGHKKNRRKYME